MSPRRAKRNDDRILRAEFRRRLPLGDPAPSGLRNLRLVEPPREPEASCAVVACTGENGNTRERNASLRLGKYTIVNPRPSVPVKSFDFTSTLTKAAPFVVAVTVEL